MGYKQERYELALKSEGKWHTHYPVPSNVSRRAIELEKTSGVCMPLYLNASRAEASEIDRINASGFTQIASERCHDVRKEIGTSG